MPLTGTSLVGNSVNRERVEDDFYATPEESTLSLLEKEEILFPALEPACGQGHISRVIKSKYESIVLISSDIADRGYGITGVDFLNPLSCATIPEYKFPFRTVITNPPFKFFTEFIKRGLDITTRKLILFGKIQALEGVERTSVMEASPLKTIYVFKKRQNPLRNGSEVDENGKPWSSTMCFAWYVWDKGYTGKPMIEWL